MALCGKLDVIRAALTSYTEQSRHCDRHNNDCVSYSEEKLGCKWVAKLLANATASRLMQFKYCTQSHQLMRGMIIELG